jgi:biopolymer transport protein ExbD
MEPVGLDFNYKRPSDDEDEDVDMIPLIDVSLVLLVFFMLSASTVAMASQINVPDAENGILADLQADNELGLHIDITKDDDGNPVFALRAGEKPPQEDERDLRSMGALLDRLKARLAKTAGPVDLQINADKDLKAKVCRNLTVALRVEPFRSRISEPFYGVGRKQP